MLPGVDLVINRLYLKSPRVTLRRVQAILTWTPRQKRSKRWTRQAQMSLNSAYPTPIPSLMVQLFNQLPIAPLERALTCRFARPRKCGCKDHLHVTLLQGAPATVIARAQHRKVCSGTNCGYQEIPRSVLHNTERNTCQSNAAQLQPLKLLKPQLPD